MEISLGVFLLITVSLVAVSVECRHLTSHSHSCSCSRRVHGNFRAERPVSSESDSSISQQVVDFINAEKCRCGCQRFKSTTTTTTTTTTEVTSAPTSELLTSTDITTIDVEELEIAPVQSTTEISLVSNDSCTDSTCSTDVVPTSELNEVDLRYKCFPISKCPKESSKGNKEDKVNKDDRPHPDKISGGSQGMSVQSYGYTHESSQSSSNQHTQGSSGYSLMGHQYESSLSISYTGDHTYSQTTTPNSRPIHGGHRGQGSQHHYGPTTEISGGTQTPTVATGKEAVESIPALDVETGDRPQNGATVSKPSGSHTYSTIPHSAKTTTATPTEPLSEDQHVIPKNIPTPPNCGVFNHTLFTRITGGSSTVTADKWPWMVVYGYANADEIGGQIRWQCGGVLVTPKCSITAAHCLNHPSMKLKYARFGDLDIDDDEDGAKPITKDVLRGIRHPQFNKKEYTYDIAVVELKRPLRFTSKIKPICLPFGKTIRNDNFDGMSPYIAGWGNLGFRSGSNSLLHDAQVSVVSNADCAKVYTQRLNKAITSSHICAGGDGRDACQGDSGGPLMVPWEQHFYTIGVVSFGFRCGEIGYPGVYTRITSYLPWLQTVLV